MMCHNRGSFLLPWSLVLCKRRRGGCCLAAWGSEYAGADTIQTVCVCVYILGRRLHRARQPRRRRLVSQAVFVHMHGWMHICMDGCVFECMDASLHGWMQVQHEWGRCAWQHASNDHTVVMLMCVCAAGADAQSHSKPYGSADAGEWVQNSLCVVEALRYGPMLVHLTLVTSTATCALRLKAHPPIT